MSRAEKVNSSVFGLSIRAPPCVRRSVPDVSSRLRSRLTVETEASTCLAISSNEANSTFWRYSLIRYWRASGCTWHILPESEIFCKIFVDQYSNICHKDGRLW